MQKVNHYIYISNVNSKAGSFCVECVICVLLIYVISVINKIREIVRKGEETLTTKHACIEISEHGNQSIKGVINKCIIAT